ncbi:hypothetical protein NDU88_005857 [Pleurodeles waltl]|uniref:Uncharacterized protein n=1 Tax=Pleurodeles waltl TaxID=8319 RepID=A0AAV7MB87_PLEWA|nr:hypothetical protein NDU88_005857 [Pleurodeles waltl]
MTTPSAPAATSLRRPTSRLSAGRSSCLTLDEILKAGVDLPRAVKPSTCCPGGRGRGGTGCPGQFKSSDALFQSAPQASAQQDALSPSWTSAPLRGGELMAKKSRLSDI